MVSDKTLAFWSPRNFTYLCFRANTFFSITIYSAQYQPQWWKNYRVQSGNTWARPQREGPIWAEQHGGPGPGMTAHCVLLSLVTVGARTQRKEWQETRAERGGQSQGGKGTDRASPPTPQGAHKETHASLQIKVNPRALQWDRLSLKYDTFQLSDRGQLFNREQK